MASAPVMAGIIDPDSCEGSNQRGLEVDGTKKNARRLNFRTEEFIYETLFVKVRAMSRSLNLNTCTIELQGMFDRMMKVLGCLKGNTIRQKIGVFLIQSEQFTFTVK